MTLFGRDSLLTSYMALALDQALALGTLRTLARLQDERDDLPRRRSPGASCTRSASGGALAGARGSSVYYGTADATPFSWSCSASCAGGAWPATRSSGCSRTPSAP